jgi:hypothetical protein
VEVPHQKVNSSLRLQAIILHPKIHTFTLKLSRPELVEIMKVISHINRKSATTNPFKSFVCVDQPEEPRQDFNCVIQRMIHYDGEHLK